MFFGGNLLTQRYINRHISDIIVAEIHKKTLNFYCDKPEMEKAQTKKLYTLLQVTLSLKSTHFH